MQKTLQNLPLAGQDQAVAVVKAAKAWCAAPLGQSAKSQRAFVRNRADEALQLLDADGQAAVLAVMVANYEGWHDRCREFPLETQAKVLELLLSLRVRVGRSQSEARRLAQPLTERAKAIRKQADALEHRVRRELRERAAKLRHAAVKNRQRGQEQIAAEQERQALALLRQAEGAIGGCDHPLAAEVQHLRKKETQVRTEAAAVRALPKRLVEQVEQAIANAIAPDALMHLEMAKRLLALRLAAPLNDEWWETADQCLRFPDAGAALADAWEMLQRGTPIETVLETIGRRLTLRRAAEDPSLYDPAPEGVAKVLFPCANPAWVSCEAAMARLAEELRRTLEAPCVDEELFEKIERLAARVEAGDVSRIAELRQLQLRAAKAEIRERARAVRAFEARKRAKKALRVSVREMLSR